MRVDYDICLSDYCDIFECKEYPEKILKMQVFMDREQNYEGNYKKPSIYSDPYRYYLM